MTESVEQQSQTPENEQTFFNHMRHIGENAISTIQAGAGWLNNRRHSIGAYAATAALAAGGAGAYDLLDNASSATASTTSITEVLHKHISVNLQELMDNIHNYLPSEDGKHYTGSVGPTSAWLEPSAGGFKTNCNDPHVGDISNAKYYYQYFNLYTYGVGENLCKGAFWRPPFDYIGATKKLESKTNEFKHDLDNIGGKVLKAAHVKSSETTAKASFTRSKGTVTYNLPSSSSIAATGTKVEKIALTKEHSYTEATITIEQ